MSGASHSVREAEFVAAFGEETGWSEGRVVRFVRDRMLPSSERVFDEFCRADRIVRIATLDLDLGSFTADADEAVLQARFEAALRARLRAVDAQRARPGAEGGGGKPVAQAALEIEELEHFLRTGRYGGDRRRRTPLYAAIPRLLNEDLGRIRTILAGWVRDPVLWRRIVLQFPPSRLRAWALQVRHPGAGEDALVQAAEHLVESRGPAEVRIDRESRFSEASAVLGMILQRLGVDVPGRPGSPNAPGRPPEDSAVVHTRGPDRPDTGVRGAGVLHGAARRGPPGADPRAGDGRPEVEAAPPSAASALAVEIGREFEWFRSAAGAMRRADSSRRIVMWIQSAPEDLVAVLRRHGRSGALRSGLVRTLPADVVLRLLALLDERAAEAVRAVLEDPARRLDLPRGSVETVTPDGLREAVLEGTLAQLVLEPPSSLSSRALVADVRTRLLRPSGLLGSVGMGGAGADAPVVAEAGEAEGSTGATVGVAGEGAAFQAQLRRQRPDVPVEWLQIGTEMTRRATVIAGRGPEGWGAYQAFVWRYFVEEDRLPRLSPWVQALFGFLVHELGGSDFESFARALRRALPEPPIVSRLRRPDRTGSLGPSGPGPQGSPRRIASPRSAVEPVEEADLVGQEASVPATVGPQGVEGVEPVASPDLEATRRPDTEREVDEEEVREAPAGSSQRKGSDRSERSGFARPQGEVVPDPKDGDIRYASEEQNRRESSPPESHRPSGEGPASTASPDPEGGRPDAGRSSSDQGIPPTDVGEHSGESDPVAAGSEAEWGAEWGADETKRPVESPGVPSEPADLDSLPDGGGLESPRPQEPNTAEPGLDTDPGLPGDEKAAVRPEPSADAFPDPMAIPEGSDHGGVRPSGTEGAGVEAGNRGESGSEVPGNPQERAWSRVLDEALRDVLQEARQVDAPGPQGAPREVPGMTGARGVPPGDREAVGLEASEELHLRSSSSGRSAAVDPPEGSSLRWSARSRKSETGMRGESAHERQQPLRQKVGNAGLVLLSPWLPALFDRLGLLKAGRFVSDHHAEVGTHLLQALVEGRSDRSEDEMSLNKLLCGIGSEVVLRREVTFDDETLDVLTDLLGAVLGHWDGLGNTSVLGLQEAFLQRSGLLVEKEDSWHLEVDPRAYDMLLDRVSWNYRLIRHPWMDRPLHVDWR